MRISARLLTCLTILFLSSLQADFAFGESAIRNNPQRIALLHWYSGNSTGIAFPLVFFPQTAMPVPVLGSGPTGITFDGTYLWVASNSSDTIMKIRPGDGAVLAAVPVKKPYQLAFDGANIWATST